MFEDFAGKFVKRTMEDFKRTVKEELSKSVDDIIPMAIMVASVIVFIAGNIPPQKVIPSTITINNYYFRR